MRTFISGGVKFYSLADGEVYPDPYADNQYVGAYVVFPYEGKWCVQIHESGKWKDLTPQRFETENIAFNYAYDDYLEKQRRIQNIR